MVVVSVSVDVAEARERCIAKANSTGRRCRRWPIAGGRVCIVHGGSAPQVREAAKRRLAAQEARAIYETVWRDDAEPVTNILGALQLAAGRLEHAASVLGARVATESLDSPAADAWLRVLGEQRRLLIDMQKAGIAEKQAVFEARQMQLLVRVINGVLDLLDMKGDRRQVVVTYLMGCLRAAVEEKPWPERPMLPGEAKTPPVVERPQPEPAVREPIYVVSQFIPRDDPPMPWSVRGEVVSDEPE